MRFKCIAFYAVVGSQNIFKKWDSKSNQLGKLSIEGKNNKIVVIENDDYG